MNTVRDFTVDNGVYHLCKTGPRLCTYWGNVGDSIAESPRNDLTWHNALRALCIRK